MRAALGFALVLLTLTVTACNGGRPVVVAPSSPPPPVVVVTPPPPPRPEPADRWELLGQREVDFRADRDVITVGRNEGRFRKLRVAIRGAPIRISDMKVIFIDDSVYDPVSRDHVLRENSEYVFDLPGHRRIIKRISFLYRSIDRREGKATVLVFGQH